MRQHHLHVNQKWKRRAKPLNSKRYFIKVLVIMLLSAGIICILFKLQPDESKTYKEIIEKTSSESKQITLTDGSSIWLERNSKIKYSDSYTIFNRETSLYGKAQYDIEYIRDFIFVVYACGSTIRTHGAKFFVETDSISTTTVVDSGNLILFKNESIELIYELKTGDSVTLFNQLKR